MTSFENQNKVIFSKYEDELETSSGVSYDKYVNLTIIIVEKRHHLTLEVMTVTFLFI